MRVACKQAHQLLETVYEGVFISCSGGEVKLEKEEGWRFAVHCLPLVVRVAFDRLRFTVICLQISRSAVDS